MYKKVNICTYTNSSPSVFMKNYALTINDTETGISKPISKSSLNSSFKLCPNAFRKVIVLFIPLVKSK